MPSNSSTPNYSHAADLMKNALPYINTPVRRSMQLFIKAGELMDTLNGADDDELSACDLNGEPADMEAMLVNMKELCNHGEQELIDMILNFMKARRLYTTYNSYMKNNHTQQSNSQQSRTQQNHAQQNQGSNMAGMMEFLMTQLNPEQKSNFETMNMMMNAMNL